MAQAYAPAFSGPNVTVTVASTDIAAIPFSYVVRYTGGAVKRTRSRQLAGTFEAMIRLGRMPLSTTSELYTPMLTVKQSRFGWQQGDNVGESGSDL